MRVLESPEWATSAGGRKIALYHSRSLSELSLTRPLLLIGGVHGDEPEGVALALELLAWLKSHTGATKNPWLLITCLNPDGFARNVRTNDHGVDLNRNFPSQDWSANHREPRYFPGVAPASEPEIRALVGLVEQTQPRLIIHFHSWKPAVVIAGPPNHPAALFLSESSGYSVQPDIGYPTPGSLGQWGWLDQRIPVICTEEAERTTAAETWTRFGPGLEKIFGQEIPLPLK